MRNIVLYSAFGVRPGQPKPASVTEATNAAGK